MRGRCGWWHFFRRDAEDGTNQWSKAPLSPAMMEGRLRWASRYWSAQAVRPPQGPPQARRDLPPMTRVGFSCAQALTPICRLHLRNLYQPQLRISSWNLHWWDHALLKDTRVGLGRNIFVTGRIPTTYFKLYKHSRCIETAKVAATPLGGLCEERMRGH